jgi:hypothetical protein
LMMAVISTTLHLALKTRSRILLIGCAHEYWGYWGCWSRQVYDISEIPRGYIRSITNSQVGAKSFNRLCWEYLMYSLLLSSLNCILQISGGISRAFPDHHMNVPLLITLANMFHFAIFHLLPP